MRRATARARRRRATPRSPSRVADRRWSECESAAPSRRLARSHHGAQVSPMMQALHRLTIATNGQALVDVTGPVCRWVAVQAIATGLLTIWCRHTSASLLVQENADP